MASDSSFWQRMGLHDWFLKKEKTTSVDKQLSLTPNDVYKYIVEKFNESIQQLSFANRVVFYHEFIICFNTEDYNEFMDNKKGIFGLIVHESVKKFYGVLQHHRAAGKTVEPSANKWVFRFVSNAEYAPGDKSFMGKLLPGNLQKEENLRVTYIPRQTGIAQTFDINTDILKDFHFYSEGYYEIPYQEDLVLDETTVKQATTTNGFARLETILPDKAFAGKKIEYIIKDEEVIVSGSEETRSANNIFKVPSEWVNTPHLRIRYNKPEEKFYVASFGEKTIVNEREIERTNADQPAWVELPLNSRIVLNGIVGINIFKS
jgi:hypothetical protein